MLPSYLSSSYLQYKEDTDTVASWLATTAKKFGYAVDLLIQNTSGQKSSKGKTRGNKGAQGAKGGNASQPSSGPNSATYTIAIKDLVNLAEWVAGHDKPPVRVPESIVGAITRAISVRRSHGKQVSGKDVSSDGRHGYFIGILEHVRDVLGPRMSSEARETAASTASGEVPVNKFEGLEIQEPSAAFLNAPVVSPVDSKQGPSQPSYKAEEIHDVEEAFLAFKLLVDDYNEFRRFIMETWDGYLQGAFDLTVASLTTNTALDLARRLEEDAIPLFAKFGGAERMLQVYYLAICKDRGEEESAKERPGDDMNFRLYEAASTIFWPTYLFLEAFLRMVDPDKVPLYKPGIYGIYDPTTDRSKKSSREKFKEDKIVLAEMLPEFYLFCIGTEQAYAEDEFMRSLRIAFKTKKASLSLLLAAQVYLDVHHVLRKDVSRGFSDLKATGQGIRNTIELNLRFHEKLRTASWPESNDGVFRALQSKIDWWIKDDPPTQAKRKLRIPVGEPFRLMKSHPLYCGLCKYAMKIQYHEVSVTFVNAWGSLMYTYHLYNAVRQEKVLQREWKDMDVVMGLHGDDVFVGDRPKDHEEYLKRFMLSIGHSASSFAKNKRSGPLQASKSGPRSLGELAPVWQMFSDRFGKDSGQVDLTLKDVEAIVSKSQWDSDETDPDNGYSWLTLDREPSKTKAAATQKRWNEHHRLTGRELLTRLRNALLGEILEVSIDYLALHRICWLLLRLINDHCNPTLKKMYGVGYLEREDQLPFVVGYILMAATNTKKLGGMLAPKQSDEVTSKLLVDAASVMDEYIGKTGRLICTILERQNNIVVTDEVESDSDS